MLDMNHEMVSQQYDSHLVLTSETYAPVSRLFLPIALP